MLGAPTTSVLMDSVVSGDPVAAELRHWAAARFTGRAICALSVLAYVERVRRQVLRPPPRLLSPIVLAAMWLRPGSFETFADWAMEQLGCPGTVAPMRGDVGLIDLPDGMTAAICLGDGRWAARGDRSVVIQAVKPAAAWRVTCRRR